MQQGIHAMPKVQRKRREHKTKKTACRAAEKRRTGGSRCKKETVCAHKNKQNKIRVQRVALSPYKNNSIPTPAASCER
jgi:hypothetical protein